MLIFQPTYDIKLFSDELKLLIKDKIIDKLVKDTVIELENELSDVIKQDVYTHK